MQRVVLFLVCVFTLGLSPAVLATQTDPAIDLLGSWRVTASTDEGSRELKWTFSYEGDKLAGESLDQDSSESRKLDRITLKGKQVKIEVDMNADGREGTIAVEAEEVSPGKLVGKWAIVGDDGTEYMSGKISALKEVSFAGDWVATAVLPGGETMESKLKLTGANEALKGSVDGQAGQVELDKLSAKDRNLRLEFDFEMDGNTIDCVIKAEAKDPTSLVGQWMVIGDDGSEVASGKWSAVRKPQGLAGVWDVVASVPDSGDYNGTLTLTESNGKYAGQSKDSAGVSKSLTSVSVDGEQVAFTVPFEYDGTTGTITVNAKRTQQGSLKGEWVLKGDDGSEYARDSWSATRRK